MKNLFLLPLIFVFFGCTTSVSEEDLTMLNGYWEIEQVTFADGSTKEFNVNPTVEYIEMEALKGFRKKMQPKFDGTYTTSNDAELFTIIKSDEHFEFQYNNDMSTWKEKIISISDDSFSVENKEAITYTYKRFKPINATE